MSTSIQIPTLRIFEDFDKIFAKEVKFLDSGDKIIVSFLNFSNISPEETHRLLMSDDSGEEQYQSDEHPEIEGSGERPRKKSSSSKRILDQRKASLNKLNHQQNQQHPVEMPGQIIESPEGLHRRNNVPHIRHTHHPHHHNHPHHQQHHERHRSSSRSLQSGYDKFQMSLLSIPMPKDYGDPSSDDLSSASEWDSDANDKVNNNSTNKEVKVRIFTNFVTHRKVVIISMGVDTNDLKLVVLKLDVRLLFNIW